MPAEEIRMSDLEAARSMTEEQRRFFDMGSALTLTPQELKEAQDLAFKMSSNMGEFDCEIRTLAAALGLFVGSYMSQSVSTVREVSRFGAGEITATFPATVVAFALREFLTNMAQTALLVQFGVGEAKPS